MEEPSVVGRLHDLVEARQWAYGFQVTVLHEGHALVHASAGVDALGQSIEPDSTFALYCAAKPLLALATAAAVSARELSLDDKVGNLLSDCQTEVANLTIDQLLTHSSGAIRPTLVDAVTSPLAASSRVARESRLISPPLLPDESSYSEASEWTLLADCLSAAMDTSFVTEIDRLLRSLQCEKHFDLNGSSPDRQRIGISLRGRQPVPLLMEATARMRLASNPGFGGLGSTHGLATLFDRIRTLGMAAQRPGSLLSSVVSAFVEEGPLRWDRTLQRRCSFGKGFMTQPSGHYFGEHWSPGSFAQAGFGGMVTVLCDPSIRVSAAMYLNGLSDGISAAQLVRQPLWERLYQDLAKLGVV